jgi:hypothetical protein
MNRALFEGGDFIIRSSFPFQEVETHLKIKISDIF